MSYCVIPAPSEPDPSFLQAHADKEWPPVAVKKVAYAYRYSPSRMSRLPGTGPDCASMRWTSFEALIETIAASEIC